MRKNILYLSLCLILISFLFSIPVIEKVSISRAYSYMSAYDEAGFEGVGLIIEENESLQNVDDYTYYSFLNECAIKNNLVIYVLTASVSSETNQFDNRIYLTTNDLFLQDRLLLFNGYAKINDDKSIYSIHGNPTSKILSFMYPGQTIVSSLHHYDEKGKLMNFISINGNLVDNVKNFLFDISEEYGEISVGSAYSSGSGTLKDDDYLASMELFSKVDIKFSISLILLIIFCSKIFSYGKKISLYKIDGSNSLSIYYKIFISPFVKIMSFLSLLLGVVFLILFHGNIHSLKVILGISFLEIAQMFILTCLVSTIIYFVIYYTPITKSIKGENKLSEVQMIAYLTKVLAIFMIIPLLLSTYTDTMNLFVMWNRHDDAYQSLSNYYTFGVQGASKKYERDMGTENYIKLRDELALNGNLFAQGKAYFIEDMANFDPRIKDEYYSIDKLYLEKNQMLDEKCDKREICIFIRSDSNYDMTNIDKKVRNMTREEIPYKIIEYSGNLISFSLNDLMYTKYIQDIPLVYLPVEDGLDGQLNNEILYFEGDRDQAQQYVDQVFIKYGYSPMYTINSMSSIFEIGFQTVETLNIKRFIDFLILLCAYVLTNRLLIEIDIDNNRKKYIVARYEGVSPYSFQIYFIKIISPSLIALLMSISLNRITFDMNLVPIFFIIGIIESALFVMYKYKLKNVRRYK